MSTERHARGTALRGARFVARPRSGRSRTAAVLLALALPMMTPGAGAQSAQSSANAPTAPNTPGKPGAPGTETGPATAGKAPLLFSAPGPGAGSTAGTGGTGGSASPASPADPMPAAPGLGTGQGFHSPQSAFAPLRDLPGVLPWRLFGEVTHRQEGKRSIPVFPGQLTSLNGTRVKVQGFMLPLQPGERQKHFLLSAVPTSCNFCLPAGPEGIIEVRIRGTGVKVDVDALVLEGTLQVLPSDPMGLLYRLTDARTAR